MAIHNLFRRKWTWFICSPLALLKCASAAFNNASPTNFVVYWGQDSSGNTGGPPQKKLSDYCANSSFDVINLAFLEQISTGSLNFYGISDYCTYEGASNSQQVGTTLPNCADIASDIRSCQENYGKTVLLSVGGAAYTEAGFISPDEAVLAAQKLWAMFGPPPQNSSSNRPFGTTSINGFDLDIEFTTQNMVSFANELRSLMDQSSTLDKRDNSTNTRSYLTAAPQCPYPDVWNNDMLNGAVSFDYVSVQFYNNPCGLQSFVQSDANATTPGGFNFGQWDMWARTTSRNRNVKVLLGVPGNENAAGLGYVDTNVLEEVIQYCKQFGTFGGVMAWDASQVDANIGFATSIEGFLKQTSSRVRYALRRRRNSLS